MNGVAQIQSVEHKIRELISGEPDLFLVEVRVKPTNNIKVFIDGDQGISIEKLVHYNRKLYREIEEAGMFPNGDFSLELSSPGLDEPLKMHRQYLKNIGRSAEVITVNGIRKEGKLISATEQEIVLEEIRGKGKKMPARMNRSDGPARMNRSDGETVHHNIPIDEIKTTRIQVKF